MSLLVEAEIWASGSRPDSRPCRSEHGASEAEKGKRERALTFTFGGTVEGEVSGGDLTYAHAVAHSPTWELLSFTAGSRYWPLKH